jgi:hypothetical protein
MNGESGSAAIRSMATKALNISIHRPQYKRETHKVVAGTCDSSDMNMMRSTMTRVWFAPSLVRYSPYRMDPVRMR